MKGKFITTIVLTTTLTAGMAAQTAFAVTEGTQHSVVEQQSVLSSIVSITAKEDIFKTGAYIPFDIVTVKGTTKVQIKYGVATSTYHRAHDSVTIIDNGVGFTNKQTEQINNIAIKNVGNIIRINSNVSI